MTKAIWMSFADPDRPKGQQFLGACVIDVSEHEAARAKPEMRKKHPHAKVDAEWLYAAIQKTWALGINPGGAVASSELPPDHPDTARVPRNRLLTVAELHEFGVYDDGPRDTVH